MGCNLPRRRGCVSVLGRTVQSVRRARRLPRREMLRVPSNGGLRCARWRAALFLLDFSPVWCYNRVQSNRETRVSRARKQGEFSRKVRRLSIARPCRGINAPSEQRKGAGSALNRYLDGSTACFSGLGLLSPMIYRWAAFRESLRGLRGEDRWKSGAVPQLLLWSHRRSQIPRLRCHLNGLRGKETGETWFVAAPLARPADRGFYLVARPGRSGGLFYGGMREKQ